MQHTKIVSQVPKFYILLCAADRVDNGDPSKIYICGECCRTFKHPGNFKQHLASHNRPPITCPPYPDGGELGPGLAAYRRACPALLPLLERPPGGGSDWDCPECRKTFGRDTLLQAHMKAEHDIEMVLPPQDKRMKEEAEEEEQEEQVEPIQVQVEVEVKEEEKKEERRWQLRGKKRKRGRGKEERDEQPEERAEEEEKTEVEKTPTKHESSANGGSEEATLPENYYCDAPVSLFQQNFKRFLHFVFSFV